MIKSVRLQSFRIHQDKFIEFNDKTNIIVGPNAKGKTSVLEAIHIVLRGKSFKGSLKEVINHNKEWARVDVWFNSSNRRTLKIKRDNDKQFILKNNNTHKNLPSRMRLPVVLFEPDDLRLVGGSPSRRRDYLDGIIDNIDPAYRKKLANYNKALRQRNNLLKQSNSPADLFVWDVQLVEYGNDIIKSRHELVKQIDKSLNTQYSNIAKNNSDIAATYDQADSKLTLKNYEDSYKYDQITGSTSTGPHRHDFLINLGAEPAKKTASRGEVRSLVLALKVIESELINTSLGVKPILLLDDVFSELDGSRRKHLTALLSNHQSIITTTDADLALSFSGSGSVTAPL